MSSTLLRPVTDDVVVRCVRAHLHPDTGSPYWLERDRALGASAYETITGLQDAHSLVGLRDDADQARYEEAARRRPIEDFLPQPIRVMRDRLSVSQTGGTTGLPKHGTWSGRYWDDTIAFDQRWNLSCSRFGIPSICEITATGSGNANSAIKSISPRGFADSISSSVRVSMDARRVSINLGVNALCIRVRNRAWSARRAFPA